MNKTHIYSIILVSMLYTGLSIAGSDFFALSLPKNLRKQLITTQRTLVKALKSPYVFSPTPEQNLHITLKEIGDVTSHERAHIQKHFKQHAQKPAFTVYSPFKDSKLSVTKDGLVLLKLYPSIDLTKLAYFIDENLKYLHKHKKLSSYSKRMDFPFNGHVTLGQISSKHKKLDTKALTAQLNAIKTHIKALTVNKYTLFQSNSPQIPRVYANKGNFYLK